jgi:hypothetical protein
MRALIAAARATPSIEVLEGFEARAMGADAVLAHQGRDDDHQRQGPLLSARSAARGLAVDGDELRPVRPCLPHPCAEGRRKQDRIDPVHQQRQPAAGGNAAIIGKMPAQERNMPAAPGGDCFVVVAIGHRAAHDKHKQQHFRQGMRHAQRLTRILNPRKNAPKAT